MAKRPAIDKFDQICYIKDIPNINKKELFMSLAALKSATLLAENFADEASRTAEIKADVPAPAQHIGEVVVTHEAPELPAVEAPVGQPQIPEQPKA